MWRPRSYGGTRKRIDALPCSYTGKHKSPAVGSACLHGNNEKSTLCIVGIWSHCSLGFLKYRFLSFKIQKSNLKELVVQGRRRLLRRKEKGFHIPSPPLGLEVATTLPTALSFLTEPAPIPDALASCQLLPRKPAGFCTAYPRAQAPCQGHFCRGLPPPPTTSLFLHIDLPSI